MQVAEVFLLRLAGCGDQQRCTADRRQVHGRGISGARHASCGRSMAVSIPWRAGAERAARRRDLRPSRFQVFRERAGACRDGGQLLFRASSNRLRCGSGPLTTATMSHCRSGGGPVLENRLTVPMKRAFAGSSS